MADTVTISDKGIALLAAIDCDLIPKTETDFDTENFERFWSLYHENLAKHRAYQLNDLAKVLEQERQDRANDCTYYRRKYRNLMISSSVGFMLGYILTKLFLLL